MEYVLLAKVAIVVNAFIKSGYLLAGSYFVKTGIRYISDYKDSVAKEKAGV
jgi:hypothetical protein